MLNHTKKIKEIYEEIQKRLFYMIPEKWDKLYLYSSVIDKSKNEKTGELFFYYIPKGILKKRPINVYEIPNKFNIDETQYLKLVELLFEKIKELREEFRKSESKELWSNITILIEGTRFKVNYDYDDLQNSNFNSYERHVLWRIKYLGITPEQCTKEEKEVVKKYASLPKKLVRHETYETGIYIRDVKNLVEYNTDGFDKIQEPQEEKETKNINKMKNQILFSAEEIETQRRNKE